nr:hypothetical protein [uncultured Dongia sp.]
MKAFATTKRGRPKRAAANDNARADSHESDLGTPEAQLKRAALAQGLDPVAAAHPLDLLLARGLIDASMHRAGFRYAGLYRRVIGRTDVSYGRLYEGLSGETGRTLNGNSDDGDLAAAQLSFRQAQAALRAEGPVVAGITERLAVFGAWPDWLVAASQPMARTQRELDLLRRGLQRLSSGVRGARAVIANENAILPRLP